MPHPDDAFRGHGRSGQQAGIAHFATRDIRDQFIAELFANRPDLRERAVVVQSRPDIVFQSLDDEEAADIRRAVAGRGEWFDDVRFGPM